MSGSTAPPELLNMLAHPQGIDIAKDYQNANLLAQGIWANREMQAKQAAGQAFQSSLNPDGTPNQARLNQNLAADPTTALAAQQSSQMGQTLDNEQFDTHMKRLTGVNAAAMALTAQYPKGVPQQAVNDELDRVGPTMGLTPQQIAQAKASFGPDPVANSRTIIRNGIQNLQAQDALHAARPGVGTQTGPGGVTQGYQVAPIAADNPGAVSVPPQQGAPGGLSVNDLTHPVQVVDDNPKSPTYGQLQNITTAEFLQRRGISFPGAGGAPAGAPAGAAAPPPSPANPPRLPSRTPAAASSVSSSAVTIPPSQGGGTAAGLAEGERQRVESSVNAYTTDVANAGTFQSRIFPLAQANALLGDSDVITGPGTEALNNLKGWLQARLSSLPGISAQTIANAKYSELNKYLQQVVNGNPFAAASDAKLASALAGSPNAHLSTLANQDVIKSMIGLERMKQAAFQEFQRSGQPPNAYASYQARWATEHDPRAFIADQLSPEQQRKMVAGMSSEARKAFGRSLDVISNTPGLMILPAMPH
jgi:hypothetical protein